MSRSLTSLYITADDFYTGGKSSDHLSMVFFFGACNSYTLLQNEWYRFVKRFLISSSGCDAHPTSFSVSKVSKTIINLFSKMARAVSCILPLLSAKPDLICCVQWLIRVPAVMEEYLASVPARLVCCSWCKNTWLEWCQRSQQGAVRQLSALTGWKKTHRINISSNHIACFKFAVWW